ncbi:hypothetical protein Tco_1251772, partial [Tanacetum coccineum]
MLWLGIVRMARVFLGIGDVRYMEVLKMINIIGFVILSSRLLLFKLKILGDGLVIKWIRFSVNELRKQLDCLALPSHYETTRWNKIVPRKVWKSVVKWLNLNLPFQLPPIELLDFVNNQDSFTEDVKMQKIIAKLADSLV